jgi:hypothetical protein
MLRLLREILRRRAALGVACVAAALLLGACDDSSSPGPPLGPPGTTLVYRLELPGGAAPSAAQLDEAARVA